MNPLKSAYPEAAMANPMHLFVGIVVFAIAIGLVVAVVVAVKRAKK